MADLLKPQVNFQISLCIPWFYYDEFAQHGSPAFYQALDVLISEQVPFHLFVNETTLNRLPNAFRPRRHGHNQISWLVFVVVISESEWVSLKAIVVSCVVSTWLSTNSVLQWDLIQVIADESVSLEPWHKRLDVNLDREFVPLYLVVLSWSNGAFLTGDALLFRDSCFCDDEDDVVTLRDFISISLETNGLETILKHILKIKMNFRGRMLLIVPDAGVDGRWEYKWKSFFAQFSLRAAHADRYNAFACSFHAFIKLHNFTFDILSKEQQRYELVVDSPGNGIIRMNEPLELIDAVDYLPDICLSEYNNYRTVIFANHSNPALSHCQAY